MDKSLSDLTTHHQTLIDTIPDIIYFKDCEGRNMVVNKAYKDFVGLKEEEIIGKTDNHFFPPELAAQCLESDMKIFIERKTLSFDEEFTLKDGKKVYFETIKSPLFDEAGDIIGLVGVSRNITERKQTEEQFKLISNLINQSNEAIGIIDPSTSHFLYVNDKACNNLGYSREELLNMCEVDIETSIPNKSFWDGHVQRVKDNGHEIFFGDLRRKDSSTFPAEVNIKFITVQEKSYMVYVVHDITERKRAEERRISEQQRFTQDMTDNLPCIYYLIDIDGNIIAWNRKALELLGYSSEEMSGMSAMQLVAPDNKDYAINKIMDGFNKGESVGEVDLITKDGVKKPFFFTCRSTYKDKNTYLVCMGLDISERKMMENEMIKAQKLESIGILAGGLAHDFNNILTAILGNVSLSKNTSNPGDVLYRRLSDAEKAALRAKDLTKQLLTFSRGGAPVKRVISIIEIIKESADLVLRGSDVRCNYFMADDIRPVEADGGQISQVIHNIILNADQAMPRGGIINIRCENVIIGSGDPIPLKSGKYIRISIEDSGIGIQEEYIPKIFDPYFTTKQKGSGLGLATAYSIVKRHDGLVTVESKLGVGTTFNIYLPATAKKVVLRSEDKSFPVFGIGKILIMDDEEIVRKVAGEMLSYLGYRVEFAAEGREAIEQYKKARDTGNPYNLLIMDLTIPGGMGGMEALKELLKIDTDVRAVVTSGYSNNPIISEYKRYGFKGFITKPYNVIDLSKIIHGIINKP